MISKQLKELTQRIGELKDRIDGNKLAYAELDKLIVELSCKVPAGTATRIEDNRVVVLSDNFATKNTMFKVASVRRYDVYILSDADLIKKQNKEAAKSKLLDV